MSTTTSTRSVPGPRTTLRRTVASEAIKLAGLRSQVVLLTVAAFAIAGLGPVQALGQVLGSPGAPGPETGIAVGVALSGMSAATLLVGVLGVLVVTAEYAPRSIRTTFALVPRRGYVVAAKALALGFATILVGVVTVAVAVATTLAVFAWGGSRVDVDTGQAVRLLLGAVWYLTGWAVLGLVAGWVTRSKLGGAALLLGVMWVLAPVLGLVPGRAGETLVALLPSSVGAAMLGDHHGSLLGGPVAGLVLWTGYLVGLSAVSAWLVSRRDA